MKILLIHDSNPIFESINNLLTTSNYVVTTLTSLDSVNERLNQIQPDCILIDPAHLFEPLDTYHLFLQTNTLSPYIVISENTKDEVVAAALNQGAADYLKPPIGNHELLARIHSVIRKTHFNKQVKILSFNDTQLKIIVDTNEVYLNEKAVDLTRTEFAILYTLASNPTRIFNRSELLESIRGLEFKSSDRAIDSHVKNLRLKIEPDKKKPAYILTVHGIGYRFGTE